MKVGRGGDGGRAYTWTMYARTGRRLGQPGRPACVRGQAKKCKSEKESVGGDRTRGRCMNEPGGGWGRGGGGELACAFLKTSSTTAVRLRTLELEPTGKSRRCSAVLYSAGRPRTVSSRGARGRLMDQHSERKASFGSTGWSMVTHWDKRERRGGPRASAVKQNCESRSGGGWVASIHVDDA